MMVGGCRCGAIRYVAEGEPVHHAICHCNDCQRSAGAPIVAWMAFAADRVRVVRGEPVSYTSDAGSIRKFCGTCGTPLLFANEAMMPGIVDIQTVTLDQPDAHAPTLQIQVAERRAWMERLHEMPEFARFPEL